MRWFAVLALMSVGCSSYVSNSFEGARPLKLQIDEDFSVEQRDSIEQGLEFWRGEGVRIETTVGPCTTILVSSHGMMGSESHCLTRVPSDDPSLFEREKPEKYNGVALNGGAVMDAQFQGELLAMLTAHEVGHILGIDHGPGVMEKYLLQDTWAPLNEDQVATLVKGSWL